MNNTRRRHQRRRLLVFRVSGRSALLALKILQQADAGTGSLTGRI